ncbi:hypothetical protein HN031_15690 [Nocardioides sp. zg-1308]|uniref:DUF7144 domain-containing protein n=1 Tax=Nocardioides renjunii TaxID=3095075 RepID=A0ABU5KB28_9ACTN|nr:MULTISPECIES: hypothetical protein [unclassified Nocardioides]MDZ5662172.1 hypothetical protein [Nocardioides sp. S-58]NPD06122.1 hypothetical protein [Nocardioides sp. zg-1308]WQQ20352.1 hypothetical protein SHK17_10550 [Nocardioides sp. S-34]
MTAHASVDRSGSAPGDTGGGWYGWVVFAGVMMMMLGAFHAMAGLVALFKDDYFLVTERGLVVTTDYTTWGWVHLLLGVLLAVAGGALLTGATWARVVAVVVAMTSAVVNLAFLAAYPLWSAIMIAVDVLIIYAVTARRGSYAEWR